MGCHHGRVGGGRKEGLRRVRDGRVELDDRLTDFGTWLPFLAEPLNVATSQEQTFRILAHAISHLHCAIPLPPMFDLLLATRLELWKAKSILNQEAIARKHGGVGPAGKLEIWLRAAQV